MCSNRTWPRTAPASVRKMGNVSEKVTTGQVRELPPLATRRQLVPASPPLIRPSSKPEQHYQQNDHHQDNPSVAREFSHSFTPWQPYGKFIPRTLWRQPVLQR